jgi:hypothetical protein
LDQLFGGVDETLNDSHSVEIHEIREYMDTQLVTETFANDPS